MKKNISGKLALITLQVLLLPFLTGCWSSHEIEEVSLEIGIALDKGYLSNIDKEFEEQDGGYQKNNNITITFQTVNTKGIGNNSKGGGSSEQHSYLNVSETGDSTFQIVREIPLRRDHPIIGHHLKVIIISEELASNYSIKDLLDSYLRDNDIRPSCLVLISKGRASNALETNVIGEIPSFRLTKMVENGYRSNKILPAMPLAKLTGKIQSESSFLLQNVISADGEVKLTGAAVIKGKTNKVVGFLNEEELEGITWINGKVKGGVVKSSVKGQIIAYEIKSMKSKILPHINSGDITFEIKIETEGRLSENWVNRGKPSDNKFLREIEKSIEAEIKSLMENVVQKMQNDLEVDVAGFGNKLKIKHPKVWKEVKKDDWDVTFSKLPIKYNVEVTVADYGAVSSD